jgi:hypothetical protein
LNGVAFFLATAVVAFAKSQVLQDSHSQLAPPGDVAIGKIVHQEGDVLDLDTTPCRTSEMHQVIRFRKPYSETSLGLGKCGDSSIYQNTEVEQR